jgi:C4-dicarboxylate-specific signal transduction histidine kinase
MGSYLSRVLRFARKEHESRSTLSLREPIETALLFVRPRAQGKHVKLHADALDSAPDVPHYGVPLTQAIVNALSNAIDASAEGGGVWLTVEQSSDSVAVVIRDEGPGLDDEQERRFFEPFFTTKEAGTGLGTVVMQQVLHDHGGRVELVREVGQAGLTIKLVLPLGKVSRASGKGSSPPR